MALPCVVSPELVRSLAHSLPSSARVYARLQRLLPRPTANLADIADLVCVDPGLAAGVLRLGNSVHFRRGDPVESIHEAINRVGMREVNRIVGMTVNSQLFAAKLPLYRLDAEFLGENSLATAVAMEVLARAAGEDERLAYTLGLLRSVGRLAFQHLSSRYPVDLPSVCPEAIAAFDQLAAWEKTQFGITNTDMSALLLAEWGFETTLCSAVKLHPRVSASDRNRHAALLHIACHVTDLLGKGLPEERACWKPDSALLTQAGLSDDAAQTCVLETRAELNRLSPLTRPAFAA